MIAGGCCLTFFHAPEVLVVACEASQFKSGITRSTGRLLPFGGPEGTQLPSQASQL